jgi:hypothetical protein
MRIGIDTLYETTEFPTGSTGSMISILGCLAECTRQFGKPVTGREGLGLVAVE